MSAVIQPQTAPAKRFVVEHYTLLDGWVPHGTLIEDGVEFPCSYDTFGDAIDDVMTLFSEINDQIENGAREPNEGYDAGEFQIHDFEKNKIFVLEFHEGVLKVVYPDNLTTVSAAGLRTIHPDSITI